jgi:aspartate/methionine/tyrosine aminotransferase
MTKITYMEWVKLKRPARYELGGSSVPAVSIDEFPLARKEVAINAFNLYGYRPLVEQIAARYDVKPTQVVTTQGCSMANYLACAAILKPGDEVLVEMPAYEPLLGVVRLLGARVKRFRRRFRDAYRIGEVPISKKTRLIVLSNLHNPSGVLTPQEVLREVGRDARRVGAQVLVDEVYLDYLFENRPASAVHLGPNFLTTSSLTKCYGFDGLRCGWILASPANAKAIWRLQDFFGVNGATPAETIASAVFANLGQFVKRTRKIILANRLIADSFLARNVGRFQWVEPAAGPVCFPRLIEGRGDEFCEQALRKHGIRVIPGRFFESPRHFRLGFGGPTEKVQAALDLL